jgi:hypothetical protein
MRKARVSSRAIPDAPDWWINEFGIKSYPASSNPLKSWMDWAPDTGKNGGACKTVDISVSALSVGIGGSFQACERVVPYIRNEAPGDMSVNWDPGTIKAGVQGSRETAFNWIAQRKQPSTTAAREKMTVNDYQYFRMHSPILGPIVKQLCESTNADRTCK